VKDWLAGQLNKDQLNSLLRRSEAESEAGVELQTSRASVGVGIQTGLFADAVA
jgi:hypothetical protein